MKLEPLERISDPVNDPIGTANKINRNTKRIEEAFRNSMFRDAAPDNFAESQFNVDNRLIGNGRIHEYDGVWPNLPL